MDESPTPWLIAEAIESAEIPLLWVWTSALLASALVLVGAIVFHS